METEGLNTLAAGDGASVRRQFAWQVPERFSIPEVCCDRWAKATPEAPAIIDVGPEGRRDVWTFRRLKEASDALAATLARMGTKRGDRVAVLLSQSPAVMVAHFAAHKLGAISLPLFTLFGEDALAYRLNDSGASAVITDDDNLDRLIAVAGAGLSTVVTTGTRKGQGMPRVVPWAEALTRGPDFEPAPVTADDPAVMIYTSGTTGAPKGALHAHRFLVGHLPSVEMVLERPHAGDVAWTPADWAWIGGLMDLAMPALYFGLPLVAHRMRKFDAGQAYALMRDEGVTLSFLPPTA